MDADERNATPRSAPASTARVVRKTTITPDVVELTLEAAPEVVAGFTPGAHVDLELPEGVVRSYSLLPPERAGLVKVAVLLELESRGGSVYIHRDLQVGQHVRMRRPVNSFQLESAPSYLFIAGGIGITPMLGMIGEAEARGADWALIHLVRDRARAPYVDALTRYGSRVRVHDSHVHGRLALGELSARNRSNQLVYCCGPASLNAEVARVFGSRARLEHFRAVEGIDRVARAFEVELAASRMTLEVPPDRSVLEVVEDAGIFVLSSCAEGTCGTCEVRVLGGEVDHRDVVLSEQEHQANEKMMICVSRALSARLVIDL
jgi:ferredoxin-NADP reductase